MSHTRRCRREARLLWIITGSGSRLRECAGIAASISRLHRVTVALTRAGFEVARVFGVLGLLRLAAPGGYYRELVVESSASGLPVVNRVAARRYDAVIVAPASSDTLAKIAHGIADNIASSSVNQALKNKTPVIILPGEAPGGIETELPCMVDPLACRGCGACIPVCPTGAIMLAEGRARISLEHCVGCRRCEASCSYAAIRCFARTRVYPSKTDVENIDRVRRLGVRLVSDPLEILDALEELGLCTPRSNRL